MKLNNLLGYTILTLLLVCFLVIPQKVFAVDFNFFNFNNEDGYQNLSEFESRRILENFPNILYDKWTALKVSGYSSFKEETALCLLKHISTLDMYNYFFRDLPIDISFSVAKEALDIARIIGTEDTSGMIGKLEKGTVNIAVSYLKEYFSKGDIKVSFGAMEMKYKTQYGEVDNPLQYIIMYKRIDDKRSKVVARIYSPKEFIPPASRGSLGLAIGFSNSLNPEEKLPPFIIEINGIMNDGMFGSYYWKEDNTVIKTVFPETVPDFGLRPKTWQEKYIINPIKSTIDSFSGVFSFFTGNQNNLTEYVFKDTVDKEAINEEVRAMSENSVLEEDYPIKIIEEKTIKEEKVVKEEKEKTEEKKVSEKKEKIDKEKEKEKKVEEKIEPIVCSKISQSVSSYDVIINEVAWMGTENSANDEWIELKNVSNVDINLKGWTLRDKEDQINIVFEDITVSKDGFLLLERTDDSSVPFETADLIYKGSLSNSEEELYLFNNFCELKDFVSGNPNWSAGDNELRKTMERSVDLTDWHTYSGNEVNNIWGTPRENNSDETIALAVANKNNQPSSSASVAVFNGGGLDIPSINYCSQVGLSTPNNTKVIINEVAWMGTENSANDEWIELKNISDEVVSLANWQLLDAENIKIIFDSSVSINPQEFYLLERTNNDSVPNIEADDNYSGALSNSDESIRLFDANCQLMDEIIANPNWPAGDNELRRTMERNTDLINWHTYSSELIDPLSGLWGTPKAENSIQAIIEEKNEDDEEEENNEEELIDNSTHLLITEIETGESKEFEYVEIYNQTESPIELCLSEDSCFYLSYYSPNSEWYSPYRNWKFPIGEVIEANSYYIIDVFGDSGDPMMETEADWKVKSLKNEYYQSGQLSNSAGSLSIFSGNPEYIKGEEGVEITDEEKTTNAVSLKIDTVSWRDDDAEIIVKENDPFLLSEPGKVIGRKWSNGRYRDTDNNLNDFESEEASLRNHTPKIPEKIQDLVTSINENQKNSVLLSWTAPFDEDTLAENLDYEIYYSRNNQIDDSNLIKIEEYVDIDIVSGENDKKSVLIKDLFYDSSYYFKVVAKDPQNNISPLSEEVSFAIDAANHQKRAPYYDFKRSGHSQFDGPVGNNLVSNILIEGNQSFTFNNSFASTTVIDENGTIYFWGSDNRSNDFYAFDSSQKKWSLNFPQVCGFYPSLGKDGTIYLSCEYHIYAISPSGKIIWQKDYSRVLTRAIIIDSKENIYFLAYDMENKLNLTSIDKEGVEFKLYELRIQNPLATELVIDDLDNIYFLMNDFVIKYSDGTVIEKQLFPRYEDTYSGSIDVTAIISHIGISFDGKTLFLTIDNGRLIKSNVSSPVLYAIDSSLSEVLWFKDDFSGPLGFNETELYYSRTIPETSLSYLGALDISDGSVIWERRGEVFNFVASDSSNRIYFTRRSLIFGYDSNNMPEDLGNTLFYFASNNSYFGSIISIADKRVYFSDEQRVYYIDILD
jgi:hypothetical protein